MWDLLMIFSLIINLWYTPIRISFALNDNTLIHIFGNLFPFIILILNTIICLNSSTFSNGNILEKKKEIFIFYMKNDMFYDFLSILAFYFSYFREVKGIEILYFFRFRKLSKLFQSIKEDFIISDKNECILELIKLLIIILYSAHIFGCIWYLIGEVTYSYEIEESWLETVYK